MRNSAAVLGDAGTDNTDASYGAETGDSSFSMQYYRNKAAEFQSIMDSLDVTANSIRTLLSVGVDEASADELQQWLAEFDGKKYLFRGTAEAINAGAYVVNAAGGRFPVMQIPQTLGFAFAPALPLVAIAAFATAATLIAWGKTWMSGVNRRLHDQRMLDAITDPEAREQAARAVLEANSAQARVEASPLATIATVAKWGAIGYGAFMIWRMWQNR
jgi:hypothetical protein